MPENYILNENGIDVVDKRREVIENFRRLEVLVTQASYVKGCARSERMKGNEYEVWEGMEGGVEWRGMGVKSKGRGKEEMYAHDAL